MAITVHTMGAHYRWEIPEQLRAQLWLAHNLREDLVTLQHEYEARTKEVWSSFPDVAATEDRLTAAELEAEALAEKVKSERIRQRTKRVTGPVADQLAAARKTAKEARIARRAAIAAVRDTAKAQLTELSDELKAAHKRLYAEYCQSGHLYWATFNATLDHHKTAVKRMQQLRAAGRPAQMRHHRFDGTGTIAVQLQRQSGQPQRTPALIGDPEGKYRNVFYSPWVDPDHWDTMTRSEQRKAGRVTVTMRCGSTDDGPAWIAVPVQQHRMLPADADITGAQLTVTRKGSATHVKIAVTARVGEPEPITDGPTVAVHLGWRDTDTGTVVAHWRASEPLDVPFDMRDIMPTDPGGRTGTVVIPTRIVDRIESAAGIASQRSDAQNEMKRQLVEWLTEVGPQPHPTRDGEEISAADATRWRNPGRFAALAMAWRDNPPSRGEQIAYVLESWRAIDKGLWNRQEGGRRKALGHRTDIYRQVAAFIADQAGVVVVDDTSIADIAARPTELPNEVEARIARRRGSAAPGELREAVRSAAVRDGVGVEVVAHKGLSRTHAACGHENPADDRYMSVGVVCDGCGRTYDQDLSATLLMLQRVTSTAAAT